MELGIEAARWVVSKALGPASGGVLEAWAASSELGNNIRELRMELLYAQGMLNNARGRDRDQEIQNPALTELLQELRGLGYRADDVMDELEYFRIQDELEGTYHTADEDEEGCLRNCSLNVRHTAAAIAKKLACCGGSESHNERDDDDDDDTRRGGVSCGAWPCLGHGSPSDDDDQEEESQGDQQVGHGCISKLTSSARRTFHAVGKHLPCHSASCVQCDADSNNASIGQRRFLCCARPNKHAPHREDVIQTPKLKFNRVEMSQTMKEIVEQLKPVCAKVSIILNLKLLDSLDGRLSNKQHTPFHKNSTSSRPITTSEPVEPELYGRKDKTNKIIHDITKGEYCDKVLTVLPIVGPGGIGKTTLVQYLYNNVELQKHFEIKLWVCVSVNCSMYRLTQEITDKLEIDKKDSPDIEEKLKSKRFLLVLDDMWNCSDEDEWKRFLVPFSKAQTKGSVIIVTTRIPAVAQTVKTVDHHIDLEGLDHEAFEQLFFACVFGDNKTKNDHSDLLETGDMILEKLKGSPLAAKTVGRLLRNNLDLDHWKRVLESREWESQTGDHDIMPALKLSFDYLPFHLQQCFTYCALFPEDYKFGREELIHLWIGLDVLRSSHNENKSIEAVGLSNLIDLVNYGFFKMEEEHGDTRYVIHDLLHELALQVSAHECISIYSYNVSSTQIPPSIRHLSLNIDDSSVKDKTTFDACKEDFNALGKRLKVENLHSLMLFGKHQISFVKTFGDLFRRAKALRVIFLSIKNYSMEDLLPNYLNLVHLRYLRISGVSEERLCNNISRCYHLRVLDLHQIKYGHYDLPKDVSNLVKLRHFLVSDHEVHSRISNVGKLKSLQELSRFKVKEERQGFELREIGHLFELSGSLHIYNLEKIELREEAEAAKLVHKKRLHKLILDWDINQCSQDPACEEQVLEGLKPNSNLSELCIRGHHGAKCPSWLSVHLWIKGLKSLCLDSVNWKTFPPIGRLWLVNEEHPTNMPNQNFHNLRRIEIVKLQDVKKWVIDSTCQFYFCLEVLKIKSCSEIMELSFSNSTSSQQEQNIWFPKLQELEIVDCPKLSLLPPVPWTRAPCSIRIEEVGLGFQRLVLTITSKKKERLELTKDPYRYGLTLDIKGKRVQNTGRFWMDLKFENLTEIKHLMIDSCPPLPLDRLKMLSSLKHMSISNVSNAFLPVEKGRRVKFELPIEGFSIDIVGATGKELTQVLCYMPKLLDFSIISCKKITGLGVLKQQHKLTPPLNEATKRIGLQHNSWEEEEIAAEYEGLLLLPPQLQELFIRDCPELSLRPDDSADGLQGLRFLRSLTISACPKFLPPSSASFSTCCPFPTSLQELDLWLRDESATDWTLDISNLASLTRFEIRSGGNLKGSWRHLPRGSLTQLHVRKTRNFFLVDPEPSSQRQQNPGGLSSPFSVLQRVRTDDAKGLLAPPICSFLSSSLTCLILDGYKEIERFTNDQAEALQLLTSLQVLLLFRFIKLRCLPAGLRGLPNLKKLCIASCAAIRSLPKGCLPNSLQELEIQMCKAIRTLPKDGLPSSLQHLDVRYCDNEELKRHCRKLIGTIPIIEVDD